jgi:hypothetical protein
MPVFPQTAILLTPKNALTIINLLQELAFLSIEALDCKV